ncbi:MAG TPA: alpha/beta hydrolase [Polyangiaceae bacterium]|nr:alpha/beta hydrolase [Polyangiaceae bacterium]
MSARLPSVSDWRAQGTTFEWCGQRVFERTCGSGEALLLIHGFPTASWDWSGLWSGLCERFHVIAFDMLGFGFSSKPQRFDYSILNQANLCEAVVGRHRIERYRILTHDYGVSVTQELLARQRDRGSRAIESVCFLNGGLFPETHRPVLTQQLLASPLGPLIARLSSFRTFEATMKRIWGSRPIRTEELEAMWALVTESEGLRVMPDLIGYMEARRRHRERWVGALVHGSVPLRLVNGLDDPISGSHMVARYRELIPSPDVVALAGVGHYPQLEAADAVLEAALEFFDRARP